MKDAVKKFYEFLDRPLFPSARLLLVVLLVPLFVSLVVPLWQIRMEAPQYPRGLHMDIYSYTIEGGNDGHDIVEINTLNHYIGMHKIDRQSLSDPTSCLSCSVCSPCSSCGWRPSATCGRSST